MRNSHSTTLACGTTPFVLAKGSFAYVRRLADAVAYAGGTGQLRPPRRGVNAVAGDVDGDPLSTPDVGLVHLQRRRRATVANRPYAVPHIRRRSTNRRRRWDHAGHLRPEVRNERVRLAGHRCTGEMVTRLAPAHDVDDAVDLVNDPCDLHRPDDPGCGVPQPHHADVRRDSRRRGHVRGLGLCAGGAQEHEGHGTHHGQKRFLGHIVSSRASRLDLSYVQIYITY